MKQIKYVGPHPEVEVEVALKRWQVVKRGTTFDVAGDLADALLDQPDNWKPAKASKSKTTKTTKTPITHDSPEVEED